MVKEKTRCYVNGFVEGRHGFNPLGKVINCNDYIFVSVVGCRLQVMKSMPHLQKGLAVIIGCRREGGVCALLA